MNPKPAYSLTGTVVHGRGIGKLVGMPTANLETSPGIPLPPAGVYLTRVLLEGREHLGVTNVGTRPTIDRDLEITVETHLLNFSGDLYGREMTILLYDRLRSPLRFPDFSQLLEQIRRDCDAARKFFGVSLPCSPLFMDAQRHSARLGDVELSLSPKEFDLLYLLYSNPDTAFTQVQLYEAVWHQPANGFCHPVENTVFQIRKRLRPYPEGKGLIRTIPRYGYKFGGQPSSRGDPESFHSTVMASDNEKE